MTLEAFRPTNQAVLGSVSVQDVQLGWRASRMGALVSLPMLAAAASRRNQAASARDALAPTTMNPHHDHYPTRGPEKEHSARREQATSRK